LPVPIPYSLLLTSYTSPLSLHRISIIPPQVSCKLAATWKEALVVIPECGHVPQEECPEPFMQAVTEFLSDLQ